MKKIIIHTILLGTLSLTACKKWLDVKPVAQTTKAEMFTTEKGFRDALTGAYIHLKGGNTYGGAMMWGNIEYMAKNWDVTSSANAGLTNLVNANYSDAFVRGWLDNMYGDLYKIVADANSILEQIDAKRTIFTNHNYELIKGEALILRAFAHFDLMRLFGPMPDNPGAQPILPYVKRVSSEITDPVPYAEFMQQVLADLDAAEALLKDTDPFTYYSLAELNPSSTALNQPHVLDDDFYMYRQIRMNYYTALALKARVYLWLAPQNSANRVNAAKYAQMVLDAKDHIGASLFRLGKASDIAAGDYTMSCEHITAVSMYNLKDVANNTFGEGGSLARYDFNIQDGYYYLNNLFPVTERQLDVRYVNMWSYKTSPGNSSFVMYKKFLQKENQPILQAPLLRLSEMYLILTECAATKTEAEGFYSFYCGQKGIPFTSGFNAAAWETDRKNKLIREYVREFYGEGQTFFAYKRYNVATLPSSWTYSYFTGNTARYIVPKPDRELNYHNN